MKRVGLLLLAGVLALGCKKDASSKAPLAAWQWVVTGMKPGSVAAEPSLVVCEANGSGCAPVKAGVRLTGSKLVRLERGVSAFELDAATHVEVAEGSELLVQDAPRTLELRAGGVVLSRAAEVTDAGPLVLKLVDRALTLVGRTALVARLENANRGQLFVTRGVVAATEPAGAREFRPGEGAVFQRKAPDDLQALFAGKISRFRQAVLAIAHPPPPPTSQPEPRGLGTMTARVPGTTAVVGGVRLAQHRVRAVVRDGVAQTEVEEVFQNDGNQVLEGRYVFPLPPDATISGLTLFVNDAPVEAELVEKQRAAAIFKSIVEDTVRPRDPALLEWVRGSEFSLKVFPIPAKGSRKVILRYQQTLTSDGPSQAYVYPLSFGAARSTPIDQLSIDVDLSDAGEAVTDVVASGYPATVTGNSRATHVALRATASAPDHDFAVSYRRAAPGATVATSEQGFVALRLRAELPSDAQPPAFQRRDRVLVVDASQSQSAESFAALQQLAFEIVRGLEPDEHFAVLLCDSACESFPKSGLSALAGGALAEAEAFISRRKPSGASDLAGALRAGAERAAPGASVQLVYVGDGAASAGELAASSIVARVRPSFEQRKVDLRLFGAGTSVDELTLGALARELSGSYDNVSSGASLAERSEELVTGLRAPLLVAPTLEVPGALSEVEPRVLPNLRLGEEFMVLGKYAGNLPFNITLKARLNGEPYALLRGVAVQSSAGALPFAARSWAETRIRELSTSGDPSATRELIELSKRFRVMSRETSWLVLENERMFAELGIPRQKAVLDASAAERAALASELDQQEPAAPSASNATPSPAAEAPRDSEPAKKASQPPAAAPAAPAPAGPSRSGSSGGELSDIGSDGSGAAHKLDGPKGNAAIGAVSVSGGTIPNAARVVAGMRAGFRSCYQRDLAANPDSGGTLQLTLKIDKRGNVAAVTASASGSLSSAAVACVQARARAAQLDAPDSGGATIVVPVTFIKTIGGEPVVVPSGPSRNFESPTDRAVSRAGDEKWTQEGGAAIEKLQAELAASPSSRKRHEALVRGLLLRGRFVPALAAAERFVELDPDLALGRELLAYAAVASGDRARAAAAIDGIVENAATDLKAQGRAARAFEALGDETRACAHWRSVLELAPSSDAARFEALRCRARVMNDRHAALLDARASSTPGPLLQKLLPLLDSGQLPAFEKSSGSAGQFEVALSCDSGADCPYVIVITPTGTVFSPWTPALGRSSPTSFAFSGLLNGAYRVLLVGGSPTARGRVDVRALNARNSFAFGPGHAPTLATTQVSLLPAGSALRPIARF
jgi:Ca-activated chloride channel family protein